MWRSIGFEGYRNWQGSEGRVPRQVAALPVRAGVDGGVEVLLVTSRRTRRWVIPKGWPWTDRADHEAAAGEAEEEAGVRGVVSADPLGRFTYDKQRRDGVAAIEVAVFLLRVTEELGSWPEQHQRQRVWLAPAVAAERVAEPELRALLLALGLER